MNDGAADPQGRFWAGTIADHPGAGVLFRMERDGRIDPVLDGLTTSNGIGWSPDGRRMYLADSGPRVIHASTSTAPPGRCPPVVSWSPCRRTSGPRTASRSTPTASLWVAIWGGGRVHRYSPAGELRRGPGGPGRRDDELRLRGGPDLHRLYVDDRHRGLDGRRALGRSEGRARLPIRDRRHRTPGRPVPPGPSLVAEVSLR